MASVNSSAAGTLKGFKAALGSVSAIQMAALKIPTKQRCAIAETLRMALRSGVRGDLLMPAFDQAATGLDATMRMLAAATAAKHRLEQSKIGLDATMRMLAAATAAKHRLEQSKIGSALPTGVARFAAKAKLEQSRIESALSMLSAAWERTRALEQSRIGLDATMRMLAAATAAKHRLEQSKIGSALPTGVARFAAKAKLEQSRIESALSMLSAAWERTRALEQSRIGLDATMRMLAAATAAKHRLEQSRIGSALPTRRGDAVQLPRHFPKQIGKIVVDDIASSVRTHPADTEIEHDQATAAEVVVAHKFELRFSPMPAPQAIESAGSEAVFDSQHWRVLTDLEQRLRHLVQEHLRTLDGENWVKRRVPESVRKCWEERQGEDRAYGRPVYALVQYANFMDLADVISRKDNWDDAFKPVFRKRDDFIASLRRLHPVRKAIAHSRPLDRDDALTLLKETTWIFGALGMSSLN